MALAPGTRLGPYEVVAPLGEGGMGEVYRATDTRLGRTVALKVLGADTVRDPAARERFEREARLIARLQHPHICVLHDVGVEGDTPYLVMELLAGETLDARLIKGHLPLDDALVIGAQIAQALDAAHRQGIAHRDLKPANVMLVKGASRTDAKLLDFGVARPVDAAARAGQDADDATGVTGATTAAVLTDRHTLVGTLPYMAPEQLAGQPADARTDLWALGCVLYEMLTGTRPFAGKTTASLMAAILEQPAPPLADRAPLTPPLIDHLVRRCLEKDPEHRWQSARDVALELDWARGATSGDLLRAAPPALTTRRGLLFAAGGALAAGIGGWMFGRRTADRADGAFDAPTILTLTPPAGMVFAGQGLALSPDGRALATIVNQDGTRRLLIRRFDEAEFRELPNTIGAEYPVFSPDGEWLLFWAADRLSKVPVAGGPAQVVTTCTYRYGATWLPGRIVFASNDSPDLLVVPDSGGTPTSLVSASAFDGQPLRWPRALRDGKTLVFTTFGGALELTRLAAFDLDTGSGRVLGPGTHAVPLASSVVAYSKDGLLHTATIGAGAAALDEPQATAHSLLSNSGGMASLDCQGRTVAWHRGENLLRQVVTEYDRAGRRTVRSQAQRALGTWISPVSPDGRYFATAVFMGLDEIIVTEIDSGSSTRVAVSGRPRSPAWSTDGRTLYFTDTSTGTVFAQRLFSDARPVQLARYATGEGLALLALSDSRLLIANRLAGSADVRVEIVGLGGDNTRQVAFDIPTSVGVSPRLMLSPDAGYVLYYEGDTSRAALRARHVNRLDQWVQLAAGVGMPIGWGTRGVYTVLNNVVHELPVTVQGSELVAGTARPLFEIGPNVVSLGTTAAIRMRRDGESFVAIESADGRPDEIVVMLNGAQALRRA